MYGLGDKIVTRLCDIRRNQTYGLTLTGHFFFSCIFREITCHSAESIHGSISPFSLGRGPAWSFYHSIYSYSFVLTAARLVGSHTSTVSAAAHLSDHYCGQRLEGWREGGAVSSEGWRAVNMDACAMGWGGAWNFHVSTDQ